MYIWLSCIQRPNIYLSIYLIYLILSYLIYLSAYLRQLHLKSFKYIRMFKYTNGILEYLRKTFLGPGHLSIRNQNCLHIHLNIRMELVFHTTSGASRSRLPSIFTCRYRISIVYRVSQLVSAPQPGVQIMTAASWRTASHRLERERSTWGTACAQGHGVWRSWHSTDVLICQFFWEPNGAAFCETCGLTWAFQMCQYVPIQVDKLVFEISQVVFPMKLKQRMWGTKSRHKP